MLCFHGWGKGEFHVPVARCLSGPVSLSARTQRPPCSFAAHVHRLSSALLKSSLSLSTERLFVTGPAWLSSVKSSPITVSGTMVYSKDHSPWLVWREWFVNHYSAACRVRNTWGMQITCHQIDSCAGKSDKLHLLLSQIGFFPLLERPPSPMSSHFRLSLNVFYFSVFFICNYLIEVAVKHRPWNWNMNR